MPFDLSTYFSMMPGMGQSAARRELTLEDLWRPSAQVQYPAPPEMAGSFGDLGRDAASERRREALLRAAMAFGGRPGDIGANLAGAASDLSAWEKRRIAEENGRRDEGYGRDLQRFKVEQANRDLEVQDQEGERTARGRLALVKEISAIEPEWAERAEGLALSGDEVALRQMLKDVEKNRQYREAGYDPYDPFVEERIKQRIQADETIRQREETERLDRESEQKLDAYWQEHGKYQAPPQYEPLSRVAEKERMLQGIRLDFEGQRRARFPGAGAKNRIGKQGDVWVEFVPTEGGSFEARPIPGQRETGSYASGVVDGRRVVWDRNKPEGGFWEQPKLEGSPPKPLTMDQKIGKVEGQVGRKLSPEERRKAESEYLRGTHSSKIAAQLRAPKPIEKAKSAPTVGPVPGEKQGKEQKAKPGAEKKKAHPPREWEIEQQKLEIRRLRPDLTTAEMARALKDWMARTGGS